MCLTIGKCLLDILEASCRRRRSFLDPCKPVRSNFVSEVVHPPLPPTSCLQIPELSYNYLLRIGLD